MGNFIPAEMKIARIRSEPKIDAAETNINLISMIMS